MQYQKFSREELTGMGFVGALVAGLALLGFGLGALSQVGNIFPLPNIFGG